MGFLKEGVDGVSLGVEGKLVFVPADGVLLDDVFLLFVFLKGQFRFKCPFLLHPKHSRSLSCSPNLGGFGICLRLSGTVRFCFLLFVFAFFLLSLIYMLGFNVSASLEKRE